MTKIIVNANIFLDSPSLSDVDDYVKYLNDREIYDNTMNLPFPYTRQHAIEWIEYNIQFSQKNDLQKNWSVRTSAGETVGGIGLHVDDTKEKREETTSVEIGYWLAAPFRNQGIMTQVVKAFCAYIFTHTYYTRITAHPFSFNRASHQVAIKAGFKNRATLKDHFIKDGKRLDAEVFEINKTDS